MANANSNELKKTPKGKGEIMKQSQVWNRHTIKAAIAEKGFTLTDLAMQHGLSPQTVRNALDVPSKSGEIAIAKCLEKPVHELFPDRWTSEGKRIYPRYSNKECEV